MSEWNNDIKKAPWQKVIWVKNDVMKKPILATRGYTSEFGVCADDTFFTSVLTSLDRFTTMPAGRLVCPTKWRPLK
ncbi:MAG: hypothetical protein Q8L53_16610 [Aestuariivirga sp.]|nr:hypothetical protein [Aestuariivirga sp.]